MNEELEKIICPKCFKKSKFLNGKCDCCDIYLADLIYKYNMYILLLFGLGLTGMVIGVCLIPEIVFGNSVSVAIGLIGGISGIALMIFSTILSRYCFKLSKISEKNTQLIKSQELRKIEDEKKIEEQMEKERKIEIEKKHKEIEKKQREMEKEIEREQKRVEAFQKECTKKGLFKTKSAINKEKILEIAKAHELTSDVEKIIKDYYDIESTKDILFGNYLFTKTTKRIIEIEGMDKFYSLILKSKNSRGKNENIADYFEKYVLTYQGLISKAESLKKLKGIMYYNKLINIIEKDEELNTICNNLLMTYNKNKHIDNKYIAQKMYDIYINSYKGKYKTNITEKDFLNIFDLMIKNREKSQEKYLDLITMFSKKYTKIEEFPENVYNGLVNYERTKDFYKDIGYFYIMDKKNEMSFYEICVFLLELDDKCDKYMTIIKKEQVRVKNKKNDEKEKEEERKRKKEIELERQRLLKGDTSKETKLNEEIKQRKIEQEKIRLGYQNVKDGYEFEKYVAYLYDKLGFNVEEVTKKSGDQGADVLANKNGQTYVIQAKFYSGHVGNSAVQEVVASIAYYEADKGIVVTNSSFTQSAKALAQANNIDLVDGKKIEEYIEKLVAKLDV